MGTNRDRDHVAARSSFRRHGEGNATGKKDKAPIVNGLGPTRVHGVRWHGCDIYLLNRSGLE
jgi:hypothetical protein